MHKQSSTTIPGPKRQRQRLVAELSQVVDNAIVNGQEGRSMKANILVIGIEGDIQDYILVMQYPSLKDGEDPEMTRNQQILNSLMSSLRPLAVPDVEATLKEFRAKADQNFEQIMKAHGEAIFAREFLACLYKLSGKDLNNLNNRLEAMKMLKPFRIVAEKLNYHDEKLDKLWISLQEAEQGDTSSFKEDLEKLIKIAGEAVQVPKENALPPAAETENEAAGDEEQLST